MNKYNTYLWVKEIILSCTTIKHVNTTDRLIYNFYNIYKDKFLYEDLMWFSIENLDKINN